MRHLRGFTLIEVLVTLVIIGILLSQAVPALTQQIATNKMRNVASTIQAVALKARSEAIKRNKVVTVTLTATDYTLSQTDGLSTTNFHQEGMPQGASFDDVTFRYGSTGFVSPLGTEVRIPVTHPTVSCSSSIRCPTVVVEAGGGARVCPVSTDCP